MLIIDKSDFKIIFTQDKNIDLNSILKELKLLKKDGSPYKYVTVERNADFQNIEAIKIISKKDVFYIMNRSVDFKFSGNTTELISRLNLVFSDYSVSINDIRFDGTFDLVEPKLAKNKSGDYLALGDFYVGPEEKLDNFIHLMKRDNGHAISPLVKRFSRTIFLMKNYKHALLGYAHLPTYLRMLKMDLSQQKFTNLYQADARATYILNVKNEPARATVNILDVSNNKANLKLSIEGSELIKNNTVKSTSPYILIAAKPIEIDNKRIPFFPVITNGIASFVSVLLFKNDSYLKTMPGGIDLLKIQ